MTDPTLQTRDTYDRIAARYLENARDRTAILPDLEAFAHELRPGARVLDLGAGPGIDTALLAARGFRTVGLDFSIGMLRSGRREFPGPRIQGDARKLPVATGSIDGIWAKASLLHLAGEDAGRALDEAQRILRGDGVLALAVKAGSGVETETTRYGLPRFFQYWSSDALDAVLDAHRFRVVAAGTGSGPHHEWITRIARRG